MKSDITESCFLFVMPQYKHPTSMLRTTALLYVKCKWNNHTFQKLYQASQIVKKSNQYLIAFYLLFSLLKSPVTLQPSSCNLQWASGAAIRSRGLQWWQPELKQPVEIETFHSACLILCVNYLCVHTALQQPGGQALPYWCHWAVYPDTRLTASWTSPLPPALDKEKGMIASQQTVIAAEHRFAGQGEQWVQLMVRLELQPWCRWD